MQTDDILFRLELEHVPKGLTSAQRANTDYCAPQYGFYLF